MRTKKRVNFVFLLKILLILSLIVLCINLFDHKIRPTVMTTLITHSRALTLSSLNDSVNLAIKEMPLDLSDVVSVDYSSDNKVSSIKVNSLLINLFQVKVSDTLNRSLLNLKMQEHSIPIGSLSGLILFNGKGVGIPFRISPLGAVSTEIKSEFVSAGINQTCHRIVLRVCANVSAIIPTYSVESEVCAEYTLAETIIVGVTPDFFIEK